MFKFRSDHSNVQAYNIFSTSHAGEFSQGIPMWIDSYRPIVNGLRYHCGRNDFCSTVHVLLP